tara:strand:+ start:89 stop:1051 length:963 start_codon:yes stop_codon:yes gene_type:complete
MKYIASLLTIILLISCSKKSIDDDMTVYSFDGEYNLCQNWYAQKNVFDKNEKNNYWDEYEGACNVPITIEDNAFYWNYDGSLISCTIVSRQDEYGIFPKQLGICNHPDARVFELKHEVDELWFIKIDNYSNSYPNFKIVLNKKSPRPFKKELMAIDDYINPNYDFSKIENIDWLDLNLTELKRLDEKSSILSIAHNIRITDGSDITEDYATAFDWGCYLGAAGAVIFGGTELSEAAGLAKACTTTGDVAEELIIDSELLKNDGTITKNNYCAQYFTTTKNNFDLNYAAYVCIPFEHPTDQSYEEYLPKSLNNAWFFVVEK